MQQSASASPQLTPARPGSHRRGVAAASVAILVLAHAASAVAATAPPLASTASHGIAANTFTNTNATTSVSGNVCFTTGPGTAYSLTGTQTIPCTTQIADQNAALANLNGQACVIIGAAVALEAFDTDGGLGPLPAGTYLPGCYETTGTMSITTGTTVTLQGAGVYIFRAAGGLSPAINSTVAVTGGASAADVFWTPTAATTIGAGAQRSGSGDRGHNHDSGQRHNRARLHAAPANPDAVSVGGDPAGDAARGSGVGHAPATGRPGALSLRERRPTWHPGRDPWPRRLASP